MIMAKLDEYGFAHNTVLVFMSDNGGDPTETINAPLRGAKSQTYEGGIREPLIIRWPDEVAAGSVTSVPVSTVDFYPTFCELAGAKSSQLVDGVSMVPVLHGAKELSRDALFWYYPLEKPHHLGGRSSGAVRQGDFKLIEFYDAGEIELYNLKDDLGESKNLATDHPGKAAELRQLLDNWRREVTAGQ